MTSSKKELSKIKLEGDSPYKELNKTESVLYRSGPRTCTELFSARKRNELNDIKKKIMDNALKVGHLQKVQFKDYYRPQDYIDKPKYTSMSQHQDEHEKYWRIRGSLRSHTNDHNPEKLEGPTLKWINEKYEGGKINEKQKTKLIQELQSCEANFGQHVDGQERLENRENAIFRKTFKGLNTVTHNRRALKEDRVKEMIQDMTKKFGNQVLGVHGAELPKFQNTDQ